MVRKEYQILARTVGIVKSTKDGVVTYEIHGNEFAGVVEEKCPVRGCVIAQRAKIGIPLVLSRTVNREAARRYVKDFKFKSPDVVVVISARPLI
jgi:hypothetical protein